MRRYLDRVRIDDGPLIAYNNFLWAVPLLRGRWGQYGAAVKLSEIIEDTGTPRSTVTIHGHNSKQLSICYGGILAEL